MKTNFEFLFLSKLRWYGMFGTVQIVADKLAASKLVKTFIIVAFETRIKNRLEIHACNTPRHLIKQITPSASQI